MKPLSGELAALRGQVLLPDPGREDHRSRATRTIRYVFEQSRGYRLPVITYKQVTSEQIHEVFSLYNKQGKHLNAEEIRNALYHHLAFMKALVVTAGDSGRVETTHLLEDRGPTSVDPEGPDSTDSVRRATSAQSCCRGCHRRCSSRTAHPGSASTANHINALLKRIDENKN